MKASAPKGFAMELYPSQWHAQACSLIKAASLSADSATRAPTQSLEVKPGHMQADNGLPINPKSQGASEGPGP